MRIVIVDPYYDAFLAAAYASQPGLADLGFEQQRADLLDRFFGTADFYSHNLRELGHDAQDLISNCEPLQRRWAAEAGVRVPWRRRGAMEAILDAQIEAIDPDVVYVHTMGAIPPRQLARWRRGRRLIVGQIASSAPRDDVIRGYDLVVTSFPHFVPRFGALGVETIYMPLAFEPRVGDRLGPVEPRWNAVFVGGVDPRVHVEGTRLLEHVADAIDVQVWGYGAGSLPAHSPIRRRWHGEAWGIDMYRALAEARVVVNRHIEAAEGHANNMRLFEATGVGAAVVTESAPNLAELFVPGEEVVTYDGPDDLVGTVRALLADEDRRQSVARAGQARTLTRHTWPHRMAELAQILDDRLLR